MFLTSKTKLKEIFSSIPFLIFIAFLLWVMSFYRFLTGEYDILEDATGYLDHTKFYLENLVRGVFPLWNPAWNCGVPNEFFLSRLGAFNPLLIIIVIINKLGVPFLNSYLIYLTVYHFIAMVGFYLIVKHLLRDAHIAFIAFLLLLFSSLGMRIFDSYIHLVYVPSIWFFYFLLKFTDKPNKHSLLGITFTLMVILTTYIPFYFVAMLLFFLVFFTILYIKDIPGILKKYFLFIFGHKMLVCMCIGFLGMAAVPGYALFKKADKGEIVLPRRHGGSTESNTLKVSSETTKRWAMAEDLLYSSYYNKNLKNFQFAVLYVPLFALIMFLLGMVTNMNKRMLLLFFWAVFFLIMGIPKASPLYEILHQKIFFFKFFRNLHFFLWILILPVSIIFIVEQLKNFLSKQYDRKNSKRLRFTYICAVHCGLFIYLLKAGGTIMSSYAVLGLSFLFFTLYTLKGLKLDSPLAVSILLLGIVVQPLEVFQYTDDNMVQYFEYDEKTGTYEKINREYGYTENYLDFNYLRGYEAKGDLVDAGINENKIYSAEAPPGIYYGLKWYNFLRSNLRLETMEHYSNHKFVVYDHIQFIDEKNVKFGPIAKAFAAELNKAFVSSGHMSEEQYKPVSKKAGYIKSESPELQAVHYDVNSIKLKTNFESPKFLVFNDNFHDGWRAYVNGKKINIMRANLAFKGLWVPMGENTVVFRYGSKRRYVHSYALLAVMFGLFLYLCAGPIMLKRDAIKRK